MTNRFLQGYPIESTKGTFSIVLTFMIVFFVSYVYKAFSGNMFSLSYIDPITNFLALPLKSFSISKIYTLITYGFVHGSFWHLIMNILVFTFTARFNESKLGTKAFLILFFSSLLFTSILGIIHSNIFYWSGNYAVGASGAVTALLYIYWRFNLDTKLLLFFILPVKIKYIMYLSITVDAIGTLTPLLASSGIAHNIHFAGYAFGFLYLKYGENVETFFLNNIETVISKTESKKAVKILLKEDDKKNFYTTQIDPILKKISETGIESLSDIEKHILKKAESYKNEK